MYCRSSVVHAGSSGNSRTIARIIGMPSSAACRAAWKRYGISRAFSRVNFRVTSTASSSNSHGTRYDELPCSRLWEESRPKASHRLKSAGSGVPSKPPMSWLQNPKPDMPSDSPPRRSPAMAGKVDSQSPLQWTGNCWDPAVAERAKTTASPAPRRLVSSSKTVRL